MAEDFNEKIESIEDQKRKAEIEKELTLEQALKSDNPEQILKAEKYAQTMYSRQRDNAKSMLIDPWDLSEGMGYKEKPINLSFQMLRSMAQTPVIRAIINTRKEQIAEFAEPQPDKYSTGFVIKKKGKSGTGRDDEEDLSDEDKRNIDYIINFLMQGGDDNKKWHADSFEKFLRKMAEDSLALDQSVAECVYTKGKKLHEFFATDAATYRVATSYNDENYNSFTGTGSKKINGYYPSYVQIYQQRIVAEFYPWELIFGIRNPQTDLAYNGYGRSELEDLVQTVTAMLNADQYNANIFSNGSHPKGILRVSGDVPEHKLKEFKRNWESTMKGVNNSHKTAVMEAEKAEWVDLQKSNRDMEFSHYHEYLIRLACSIYKISPEEIGFHIEGSEEPKLSGRNNKYELMYSRDKGLKPLLRFFQRRINESIVSQIDDRYEFQFVGIDADTEEGEEDRLNNAVKTYLTVNEVREQKGLDKLPKEQGDVVLDPVFLQNKQAAMMGGAESNSAVEQMTQQENDSEKGDSNPFEEGFNEFLRKLNDE